jgi:hypothetical protein
MDYSYPGILPTTIELKIDDGKSKLATGLQHHTIKMYGKMETAIAPTALHLGIKWR